MGNNLLPIFKNHRMIETTGVGRLNVGGGGWVGQGRAMGENGDTCNRTTIKKIFKRMIEGCWYLF